MASEMERLRRCFQPRQWFTSDGDPDPYISEDALMWVYRPAPQSNPSLDNKFQVGYFMPDGTWFTDSEFVTKELASMRVHYLNGGGR